jgi:hypothetical protein
VLHNLVIDGCRSSEVRATNRPFAAREGLDGTTVGGVRTGRTAHEGKPAFRRWQSVRTSRQDRGDAGAFRCDPAGVRSAPTTSQPHLGSGHAEWTETTYRTWQHRNHSPQPAVSTDGAVTGLLHTPERQEHNRGVTTQCPPQPDSPQRRTASRPWPRLSVRVTLPFIAVVGILTGWWPGS